MNSFSPSRADFGINLAKDLTPQIQAIGEFGHVSDVLPPLTASIVAFTPLDLRVSASFRIGNTQRTSNPPSTGPAVSVPPSFSALPRMPSMPCPPTVLGVSVGFPLSRTMISRAPP